MFVVVDEEIVRVGADAVKHIDDPSALGASDLDLGAELRESFGVAVEVSQPCEYRPGGINDLVRDRAPRGDEHRRQKGIHRLLLCAAADREMRAVVAVGARPAAVEQVEHEIGHGEFVAEAPGGVTGEIVILGEPAGIARIAPAGMKERVIAQLVPAGRDAFPRFRIFDGAREQIEGPPQPVLFKQRRHDLVMHRDGIVVTQRNRARRTIRPYARRALRLRRSRMRRARDQERE